MESDLFVKLTALCPSHLHQHGRKDLWRDLCDSLQPQVGFIGLFLLDAATGVYERCLDRNWPGDLAPMRFRPGDQVLVNLRQGLLQEPDGEFGLDRRVGLLAPLLDERAQIRGVLATGAPLEMGH